jgi:hypothetical protein
MFDLPATLSPAQLEAQTILAHMLSQISSPDSKYYPRYGRWVERHPRLSEFCLRTIRPQVWTFLQHRWSLDALKLISGDLRFEGRAIYLNGILGLDKRLRTYVGQSMNLRQRVAQHLNFRYRRDNPSLHYHALQYSIYNAMGVLAVLPSPGMGNATLPGMDVPDLLLNVLEMWMCLIFRSLPESSLQDWLPSDGTINTAQKEAREGVVGGLNIALPLDHGERSRTWVDLSESEDPLVSEYLETTRKNSGVLLVKKEEEDDSPAQRRKAYAGKARRYRERGGRDIHVSPWLVLGAMAVVAGLFLLNSKGGPQPRPRWR